MKIIDKAIEESNKVFPYDIWGQDYDTQYKNLGFRVGYAQALEEGLTDKKLLKIAYAICRFQDFVTEDVDLEELDLDFEPTEEEIKEVIKRYDGWGMDYLDDEIRSKYFEEL